MITSPQEPFMVQNYFAFEAENSDPLKDFQITTGLRVNQNEVMVMPVSSLGLDKTKAPPEHERKSWWDRFWGDGWSNVVLGTVSVLAGVALVAFALSPAGWVTGLIVGTSAALGVLGGGAATYAGVRQLTSTDSQEELFYHRLGNAALSMNNIPGFVTGTTTYAFTRSYGKSVEYANIAGFVGGVGSIGMSVGKAVKLQRLYNFEVGLNSTKWSSRTRAISASVVKTDPKGLEASHWIPQRVIKRFAQKFPQHRRLAENLANGPLGVNFVPTMEHALVDSYRYQFLPLADKATLAASNPFRAALLQTHPQAADAFGFIPNMSPTMRPIATSLVITGGRSVKASNMSVPAEQKSQN